MNEEQMIDALSGYAWSMVDNFDHEVVSGKDVSEGYLLARFEFVLRVLVDIARLPLSPNLEAE